MSPLTPYEAARAFPHKIAAVYRRTGPEVTTAVIYNHESPRRKEIFVIRQITSQVRKIALRQADTLLIGSLDARSGWGFAGNYARVLYLIAQHPHADDFVIATGVSRTVAEFIAADFGHLGVDDWRSRVEFDADFVRPVDVIEQRGNSDKARVALVWEPETTCAQMVPEMVDADLARLDNDPAR